MAQSDAFYQSIVTEVDAVIQELGTTYQVRTRGAYNPATLTTEAPGAPRPVVGIVANQQFAQQLVQGDASWVASKSLILTAAAKPLPTEEVEVDGTWYTLESVTPIKPADIVVIYMLDISK